MGSRVASWLGARRRWLAGYQSDMLTGAGAALNIFKTNPNTYELIQRIEWLIKTAERSIQTDEVLIQTTAELIKTIQEYVRAPNHFPTRLYIFSLGALLNTCRMVDNNAQKVATRCGVIRGARFTVRLSVRRGGSIQAVYCSSCYDCHSEGREPLEHLVGELRALFGD